MLTIEDAVAEYERQSEQRFSFEPIEAHLREDRITEVADMLGVSVDLVKRFRDEGLTVDEADKVACRLGDHPSAIWPDWNSIRPISDRMLTDIERYLEHNKKCPRCDRWKDKMEDFNKRSTSPDGRALYCRQCTQNYERARKANLNKELVGV